LPERLSPPFYLHFGDLVDHDHNVRNADRALDHRALSRLECELSRLRKFEIRESELG
jgi:hypothetical protein